MGSPWELERTWQWKAPGCSIRSGECRHDAEFGVGHRQGTEAYGGSNCRAAAATVAEPKEDTVEKDVVCGMQVDPAKAAGKSEYNGKTYYFCSGSCKTKFDANPGQYAR